MAEHEYILFPPSLHVASMVLSLGSANTTHQTIMISQSRMVYQLHILFYMDAIFPQVKAALIATAVNMLSNGGSIEQLKEC